MGTKRNTGEPILNMLVQNSTAKAMIIDVCKGRRELAYGFKWKYFDDINNNSNSGIV